MEEKKANLFMANGYNIIDVIRKFDSISIEFIDFFDIMPKILVNKINKKIKQKIKKNIKKLKN